MPQRKNNPNNKFVKKHEDDQPWNRSRIEVEPAEPETQAMPDARPTQPAQGRFSDRIKISPMDDEGRATDRALKGWPMGPSRT